jgi:prepilin-type N-terminal cleavage/methylation domain-containing protein
MKNSKKGFTLIEILVVATIISMLAAGGFVSYSTFTKQSRDARRKADLEQIRAALEQYRSSVSTYPDTTYTSGQSITDPSGNIYMSKIPSDPTTKYQYSIASSPTTYKICSYQEGSAGTGSGGSGIGGGLSGDGPGVLTCGESNCNYCLGPYGEVTP